MLSSDFSKMLRIAISLNVCEEFISGGSVEILSFRDKNQVFI